MLRVRVMAKVRIRIRVRVKGHLPCQGATQFDSSIPYGPLGLSEVISAIAG